MYPLIGRAHPFRYPRTADHAENAGMAAPRQLVSAERLSKAFGAGPVLSGVSLGVAAGERIGIVGAQRRGQVDAAAR